MDGSRIGGNSVIARNVGKGNRTRVHSPVTSGISLPGRFRISIHYPIFFIWFACPLKACNPVLLRVEAQRIQQDGFKAVHCGDFLVIWNERVPQHIAERIIIRKR